MALFCDPADLGDALGAHDLDTDELTEFCTRASNRTMQSLKVYWPFPDYNATPSTPESVREAAFFYAKYLAREKQGEDNEIADNSAILMYKEAFDKAIENLNDTQVTRIAARVTNETLAFGAHNSDFITGYDDAHVLAWQDVEIEENSAAISGFHRAPDNFRLTNPGGHFGIRYDEASGLWLLWRFTSDIEDGMTVSYTLNFLKWTKAAENEATPVAASADVGRIALG